MWQPPDSVLRASDGFVATAKQLGDGVVRDIRQIATFCRQIMAATEGVFIVDSIDMANWDYVREVSVDEESRVLRMIWKDYAQRSADDISRDVFPAERYGFAMRIQELTAMSAGSVAIVLLRGFTSRDRDLAGAIPQPADEYVVERETLFSRTVYKRTGNAWEEWNTHVAPAYTVAWVPKARGVAWYDAHRLLYLVNLGRAESDVTTALHAIIHATDDAVAADRANVIRRAMESTLKVECVFREVELSREYPELKLGDLVTTLKKKRSATERRRLNSIVRVLNEYSHDTGYPVNREVLIEVAHSAIQYVRELGDEIDRRLTPGALVDFLPRDVSLTSWLETHDFATLAEDDEDDTA